MDDATLTKLKALITDANVLAGSDHVMVRVAGERIATLLADLLYEANTNMSRDQFVEEQHCVRVNFKGSGLDVDVVPRSLRRRRRRPRVPGASRCSG